MIFDWGGVLIDEPSQGLSAYCAQELGVEVRRCCEVIESHLSLFGRGETTEAVFWQRVCQELACSMPESESLWSDAFGIVSRPREAMYDLVQALQKHVKTAVLSNTELSAIPHFMAYRSECFDLKMFSCEEGIIKPERELYERCLQRLNVELQGAVFIDDRIENIDGAKDIGLQAIHYVDYQELIKQLEGLGVIYEQ